MDVVTRPRSDVLAVLMHQESAAHCRAECFGRLARELSAVKVETMSGIFPVTARVGIGAAHREGGIPTPDELIEFILTRLRASDAPIFDSLWGSE